MEEFEFPDEIEEKKEAESKAETKSDIDIEIEDDTPAEDRNKEPMPKEIVEELEKDELDKYSDEAKIKLKQLRKVYHDERRAKESADREREEAVSATTRLLAENQRMKQMINNGQKEYLTATQQSADLQLEMAKKAYKEAYDSGDSDKVLEAQQAITNAAIQLDKVKSFKVPPLQEEEYNVQRQEQVQNNRPDPKVMAWQERNSWFGQDEEMTASALGLHEKLKKQGVVIGSDEYYTTLDKTIRRRFPENFGGQEAEAPKPKSSTVVAPATRSTTPKQVRLKTSQVLLAKKLGLTNEQYARELLKMEA